MHNPTDIQLGETPFTLDGPIGILEGISFGVESPRGIAIVCHPHPLHEGTMYNKVVHMICRAFNAKQLSTIRFNYRGVGKSEGTYGNSVGEAEDLFAIMAWVKKIKPDTQLYLAGFSFGAYIAALGAQEHDCQQLFSVSPAVHNQPYERLSDIACPWVVIQSTEDEVVPPEHVYKWFSEYSEHHPNRQLSLLKLEASHFYHGKLVALRMLIEDEIDKLHNSID